MPKYLRINNQIRIPQVRLIDEKGEQLGIIETEKALRIARERDLDLVEVAPQVRPPVCKIMDYGKYLYRKAKEARLQKAKQKKTEIKGIRISLRTGKHDLDFKAKRTRAFLEKGHKVKIEMVLKGREKSHQDLARERLKNFIDSLGEGITIEQYPKRSPRGLIVVIAKSR